MALNSGSSAPSTANDPLLGVQALYMIHAETREATAAFYSKLMGELAPMPYYPEAGMESHLRGMGISAVPVYEKNGVRVLRLTPFGKS